MPLSTDLPNNPDFTFISCSSTRNMINSGYHAIMRCEGWNILYDFSGESFMFSSDPQVCRLMSTVSKYYEGGHSGASMGYTMRQLEFIAKHGFASFKEQWMHN